MAWLSHSMWCSLAVLVLDPDLSFAASLILLRSFIVLWFADQKDWKHHIPPVAVVMRNTSEIYAVIVNMQELVPVLQQSAWVVTEFHI